MRSISISLPFIFLSPAIAVFHLKWVYSSVVNVFSPWKSSRGERGRKRDRNSSFYGHTTSLALVAQRTRSVIPPMMSAAPLKASSPTNTHRPPPSIFYCIQVAVLYFLAPLSTTHTGHSKTKIHTIDRPVSPQLFFWNSHWKQITSALRFHPIALGEQCSLPFSCCPHPNKHPPLPRALPPTARGANDGAGVRPEGGSRHMTAVKEKAT